MRSTNPLLLVSLLATCSLATAGATQPVAANAAPPSHRAQAQQRFFDTLDTNHDGVVSRAEYQAWTDRRFDRLDSNHDGRVDANEIIQSAAVAERVHKRAERFVKRYDRSGTGSVSKADFEAKAMTRFERLGGGAATLTEDQLANPHHDRRGDGLK